MIPVQIQVVISLCLGFYRPFLHSHCNRSTAVWTLYMPVTLNDKKIGVFVCMEINKINIISCCKQQRDGIGIIYLIRSSKLRFWYFQIANVNKLSSVFILTRASVRAVLNILHSPEVRQAPVTQGAAYPWQARAVASCCITAFESQYEQVQDVNKHAGFVGVNVCAQKQVMCCKNFNEAWCA